MRKRTSLGTLNEKTTINLWSMVGIIPIIVGLTFWLAILWARTEALGMTVDKHELIHIALASTINDTHERVIRIEEKLNNLRRGKQ